MICWGERDCCGMFVDTVNTDRCDCLRDYCIRDYDADQRIMVRESELDNTLNYLSTNSDDNLHELHDMLRIKSITNSQKYYHQTKQIMDRLASRLLELQFDVEIMELRSKRNRVTHYVLFANYFSTPTKNIMLVYGHVNVPFVGKEDGWTYEPYALTEKDGALYGLGLTSSKGPIMCWIHAAEAWIAVTGDMPVNLRIIIDSNNYPNTKMLRRLIRRRRNFFKSVDLLISMTNYWIAKSIPLLITSHSGYIYYELKVHPTKTTTDDGEEDISIPTNPLPEPMFELCLLMNTLTDSKSGILVDGLQLHVLPMTQHDWDIFSVAEVGIMEFKERLGATRLPHEQSKQEFLKHKWCMPSLSMHSVEYSKARLSLRDFNPLNKVVAKFSVKLVPDQSLEYVHFKVQDHLNSAYIHLKCVNPAYLYVFDQLKPLNAARYASFNLSAERAYERVFNCRAAIPDTISICSPVLNEMRKYCMSEAQVLSIPFCSIHMQPNQADESMTRKAFLHNQELCATLMYEVALMPADCKCTFIKDFCYEKGKATDKDFIRMIEPRHQHISHVLYELDELEVEQPDIAKDELITTSYMLLGRNKTLK